MANAALKKITTRAKQIRKDHPSMQWKNAIKKAGAEYRGGKIGSAKKKNRQTGSSIKRKDVQRKAKRPGARRSASGAKYVERRKNRSDVPGTLTGISNAQLKSTLKNRLQSELGMQMVRKSQATSASTYWSADKRIKNIKKQLNHL